MPRSAPAPTGSAVSTPAATSNTTASRTGGAPICRSCAARTISTRVRFEYYRDRDVGFEGFTAKIYLFREEFTSRTWATRYDFPAVTDGRVKRDVIPDDTPSGAQGWFINTRRDKFEDRAAARGAQRRLRFRVDQQDHHVRRLRAHHLGVPELRHDGGGQAERRRSWRCSSRSAARCRRGVRRALCAAGLRRVRPGPRPAAQGRRAAAGRRLRDQGRQARDCRAASRSRIEFLLDEPTFEPHHHAVHQESRAPSASTRRCASSTRCNTARASTISISTSRSSASAFSATPGDSLRSYFSSQAAALKGSQQSRRHRRSGGRCADRDDHRRRHAARRW